MVMTLVASLGLFACGAEEGPEGPAGPEGEEGENGRDGIDGMDGMDGMNGMDGADGVNGADGADGLACWDLNGDFVEDAEEDTNGDMLWDVLDCQPSIRREVITGQTASVVVFQQALSLTCSAGLVPYGGGHRLVAANNSTNVDAMVTVSRPSANGWELSAHGDNAAAPAYAWRIEGWVICGN